MGIQYAVAIAVFTLAGYWLDGKFPRVRPLFTIVGLLLGFVGATTSLIYQVSPPGKGKDKKDTKA